MDLIDFLKRYSNISNDFIDDFYSLYDKNDTNEFIVNLDKIAEWLNTKKSDLKKTLQKSYKLNTDYIINKVKNNNKGAPKEEILLTIKCFKLLCMKSKTKKSIQVREYFYGLEELIDKYKNYVIEGLNEKIKKLENNQKPKINEKKGIIYVLQTSDDTSLYKIGKTHNLRNRLQNYNADKKDDIIPIYIYETDNADAVEKCVKLFMKQSQYRKYKEVYQVNIDIIKEFINKCGDLTKIDINIKKGGNINDDNSNYFIAVYK